MAEVKHTIKDGKLTISLIGHVDSANAASVEKSVNDVYAANPAKSIVLDCEKLEYISSAGLRIILRLKKSVADTVLVNVSPEVYDIFDVTGFTEMMDIHKAYRVISVDGCEVIGQGANGKVYRIDKDTIVKVYLNPDSLPEIHRERELARTAFVSGVPTAIPYDVVRIEGGGYGSVFELLNAKSYAKLLISGEKTVDEIAKMSAELLKTIHSTVVKPESLPDMRASALGWTDYLKGYLSKEQIDKINELLSEIPQDNHMMHGDFHIKNVMLQNGESLLIDMDTLCHGHPVFEFASMFNAYVGYGETDSANITDFLGISVETAHELWRKILRFYFDGADEEKLNMVEKQASLIGHVRLIRRTVRRKNENSATGKAVIENCVKHVSELLNEVNTLLF